MTVLPGWPLGIRHDLAQRYHRPAATLYKALGPDPRIFDCALNVAIWECEKARSYHWPEHDEAKNKDALVKGWKSANSGASKLSTNLKMANGLTGVARIMHAAKKSGLTFKSSNGQPLNRALAAFVQELSQQRYRVVRSGNTRYGSLCILGGSTHLPGPSVVLTVGLTHLFRLVSLHGQEEELIIHLGGPLETKGLPCWEAAAEFAIAVDLDDRPKELELAAKQWVSRHRGHIEYIGWKKPKKP